MKKIVLLLMIPLLVWGYAQNSDESTADTESNPYQARFDLAWRLVDERYWDISRLARDWQEVHSEYEPQALAAEDDDAFYEVLEHMYEEVGDSHTVYASPQRIEGVRERYGDLPCVGVFALQTDDASTDNDADSMSHIISEIEERDIHPIRLDNISYQLLEEGIGYIRVPDLATAFTPANLRSAVRQLERAEAWALIVDLRGNPGGRLIEMMQAAGVFTEGFLWRAITRWTFPMPYPAVGTPETDLPLVILIDGDVNSAAEGLAGALQSKERAITVGEATAGNVEAVLPFCLRDGSQAWIATGVLAPLRGATWEGRGVDADVPVAKEFALETAVQYLVHTYPINPMDSQN